MALETILDHERQVVEKTLEAVLPAPDVWPTRLHSAMRYAVLGGGKRLRPVLARVVHRVAGGDPDDVNRAVCGLELIHTYSLVHDDLPALDDDLLRRGRSTVHVAFDEATAVLVGDALLTEGLLILARYPEGSHWIDRRIAVTELVAEAISSRGMVGGQMEDLEATGQVESLVVAPTARLERIHRHKTGCLLRAAVETGAVLAGVSDYERRSFVGFGETLGLAFQVADDILDTTATAAELGKSPGKDATAGKLTYVTLYGLESARRRLEKLEHELVDRAVDLEGSDGTLANVARFAARRRS